MIVILIIVFVLIGSPITVLLQSNQIKSHGDKIDFPFLGFELP